MLTVSSITFGQIIISNSHYKKSGLSSNKTNEVQSDSVVLEPLRTSLMVLPGSSDFGKAREFLKKPLYRYAIKLVGYLLMKSGFEIQDFESRLSIIQAEDDLAMYQGGLTVEGLLGQNAPADISVIINIEIDSSASGKRVGVLLKAVNAYTGDLYHSKALQFSSSRYWRNEKQAIEEALFKNDYLRSFCEELAIGTNKSVAENSFFDLELKLEGGLEFAKNGYDINPFNLIKDWLQDTELNGQIKGNYINDRFFRGEIKIPALIASNNRLFSPAQYAVSLRNFILDRVKSVYGVSEPKISLSVYGKKVSITVMSL